MTGTASHLETIRLPVGQAAQFSITLPAGVSVLTVRFHYSLNRGTTQTMSKSPVGGIATFTVPGASLGANVMIDYAFEAIITSAPMGSPCFGDAILTLPTTYGFHAVATSQTDAKEDPYAESGLYAFSALTAQPQVSTPEQACARFFANPTPCTLYVPEPLPSAPVSAAGPGGEVVDANCNPLCVVDGSDDFYGRWVPYSTADDLHFYSFGTRNGRVRRDFEIVQIVNDISGVNTGQGSIEDWAEVGYVYSWRTTNTNCTGVNAKVHLTYDWIGRHVASAASGAPGGSVEAEIDTWAELVQAEFEDTNGSAEGGERPKPGTEQVLAYQDFSGAGYTRAYTPTFPIIDVQRHVAYNPNSPMTVVGTTTLQKDVKYTFFLRFHSRAAVETIFAGYARAQGDYYEPDVGDEFEWKVQAVDLVHETVSRIGC